MCPGDECGGHKKIAELIESALMAEGIPVLVMKAVQSHLRLLAKEVDHYWGDQARTNPGLLEELGRTHKQQLKYPEQGPKA